MIQSLTVRAEGSLAAGGAAEIPPSLSRKCEPHMLRNLAQRDPVEVTADLTRIHRRSTVDVIRFPRQPGRMSRAGVSPLHWINGRVR
ncbi:hypothetical protein M2428_003740 [Arthrobacter sp. ES3-54]|jgi:hypothetical protein|nr:hypothetical protein [Arthrobacter sp. ES3-54]